MTASVDGERELDIAVMLSNLLDNAVEAQKKITPDKPRSIFLKIFSYENKYSILIKNTVAKSVLQNNPRFITDKANRYLHGIGMKSIEHTVDKMADISSGMRKTGCSAYIFCCKTTQIMPK